MALGSTQPGIFLGGKGRPARKADNLTAICEPRPLTTLWAFTACYRDSFTLPSTNRNCPEFKALLGILRSRDSAVGIATGYGLDDQGAGGRVPVG
jgi:hypothetical protein